ncbi:MAG: cation-translocating P-type ATPase [Eggerthellaceae bacterium]|nr:cation-translocating P-type ATPase [Eggerthellaceae bacterium]
MNPENSQGSTFVPAPTPAPETCESGCGCAPCVEEGASEEKPQPHKKFALIAAGAFAGCALLAEYLFANESLMFVFAALSIAAGLVIVLPKTIQSLKARSIDINVLMIVAVIGAIYVRAYEEAAAVLFLFSVGEALEGRAIKKSNDAIKDLAKLAPDTALVVRKNETHELPTDQIKIGETILVKPGMSAALDGIIIRGASSFNDAAITGESIPVYKRAPDTVFAGSLSVDGSCFIQTTSTVADSTLAKIAALIKDAQKQKSTREHFVQRFAKIYTPLVIVLAALVAGVPPTLSALGIVSWGSVEVWVYRACELLVISCPCAFVISTPVTFVSALTRAARLGVLVKGGAFFEEGARVVLAAFDKTGTLTKGTPRVVKLSAYASNTATSLVEIAAALEFHSTHPLGQAVLDYAQQRGMRSSLRAENVVETAGRGIVGSLDGARFAIGSLDYLKEILSEAALRETLKESPQDALTEESGTVLYVAKIQPQAEIMGLFVVADAIRETTRETIEALRRVRKNIKTAILTGDNASAAAHVAQEVGIDEVYAALLPQDKTTELKRLQKQYGAVAFVGDGINDAPSLATAEVGIAMGSAGSAAALSSADVVLAADDLSALPKFFALCEKTVFVLKQNLVLAIGLKVLVALLVVVGVAHMWMAVLADTGVSLLVIANGMRLLKTKL